MVMLHDYKILINIGLLRFSDKLSLIANKIKQARMRMCVVVVRIV